jgi:lysyl-tRNA synthetase class 2
MKRMLAAGYGRIFQICRCWRDGERGALHLPEFTMLEWYRVAADYRSLMDECETLLRSLPRVLGQDCSVRYQGKEADLSGAWERLSVSEAFARYGGMAMEEALVKDLFDEIMVREIEPRLGIGQPTFIYDYPAERGALARRRGDNPAVAERFELYICGLELANAFSELTDAAEQRARFSLEAAYRGSMQRTVYPLPEKFLDELGDMPPSAGIAMGVDRLVMVLLDAATIDEVVAFTPEEL